MHVAVHRQDLSGFPEGGWYPEQRLTPAEALDLYTAGAGLRRIRGVLPRPAPARHGRRPGVLDRDPFTCDPAELKDVRSTLTMVGGVIAYEA